VRYFATAALMCVFTGGNVYAQNELTDLGCAQENSLRSLNSNVSTYATFVNQRRSSIRTYWLNFEGKRVFYSDILRAALTFSRHT
jgi:hypothetical protein